MSGNHTKTEEKPTANRTKTQWLRIGVDEAKRLLLPSFALRILRMEPHPKQAKKPDLPIPYPIQARTRDIPQQGTNNSITVSHVPKATKFNEKDAFEVEDFGVAREQQTETQPTTLELLLHDLSDTSQGLAKIALYLSLVEPGRIFLDTRMNFSKAFASFGNEWFYVPFVAALALSAAHFGFRILLRHEETLRFTKSQVRKLALEAAERARMIMEASKLPMFS